MSLYRHVPHPHLARRKKEGPIRVADVLPATGNPVTRFNTRAGVLVTRGASAPCGVLTLSPAGVVRAARRLRGGPAGFVQWASSQFLQLVLLPVVLVGSAVVAEVSDRIAKRQFDDVEALLHGQDEQANHLAAQDEKILAILERLEQVHAELTQREPGG